MTIPTSDAAAHRAVVAAELERCRAISEQDWPALDALLDDTLTHTHMNGRVDDKPALLSSIKARPRTVSRGELGVRIYGDTAVVTGPQRLNLGAGEVHNQVTETWIRRDGQWALVAFHASAEDPTPR